MGLTSTNIAHEGTLLSAANRLPTEPGLAGAPLSASNPLPVTPGAPLATDYGLSQFRILTAGPLTNAAQAVKAAAGNLFGLSVVNPNTVPIFIKFFNVLHSSVVVGTTVPVKVYEVPANDGTSDGQLIIPPGEVPLKFFSTAIAVLATSTLADTGAQAAPTTTLQLADFDFK